MMETGREFRADRKRKQFPECGLEQVTRFRFLSFLGRSGQDRVDNGRPERVHNRDEVVVQAGADREEEVEDADLALGEGRHELFQRLFGQQRPLRESDRKPLLCVQR